MTTTIDLNCDLGESFGPWEMGNDAAMIELATSVNVACGFHAGDADIMRRTVELAKARGVSVGAHPGYRDLHGFGRRPVPGLKSSEIENLVAYQIGALQAIATAAGHKVTHVKAHGALSNVACEDDMTARAIASAYQVGRPQSRLRGARQFETGAGRRGSQPTAWRMKCSPIAPMKTTAIWSRARSPVQCCTIPRQSPTAWSDGAGRRGGLGDRQGDQDAHRHCLHPRRYPRRRRHRPRRAAGAEGFGDHGGAVRDGALQVRSDSAGGRSRW